MHHEDGLLCPAAEGSKAFFSPRVGWQWSLGFFLPSSAALSMAPCQGSFGPFWLVACLLLLHLEGITQALALSGSLCCCKFVAEATSGVRLVPFTQVFLLGQNSLCLEELQACCTTFQPSLHAIQAWGKHESGFHASLAKKHSGDIFLQPKIMLVIDRYDDTFENTPGYHTPLLGVISTNSRSSSSCSLGNKDCLDFVPAATFCDLSLPDCKGCCVVFCFFFLLLLFCFMWGFFCLFLVVFFFFFYKLKNALACSWLHVCCVNACEHGLLDSEK